MLFFGNFRNFDRKLAEAAECTKFSKLKRGTCPIAGDTTATHSLRCSALALPLFSSCPRLNLPFADVLHEQPYRPIRRPRYVRTLIWNVLQQEVKGVVSTKGYFL